MPELIIPVFTVILALVARIHHSACELPNRAHSALTSIVLLASKWALATRARVTSVLAAAQTPESIQAR
jgi:hypothetical protein